MFYKRPCRESQTSFHAFFSSSASKFRVRMDFHADSREDRSFAFINLRLDFSLSINLETNSYFFHSGVIATVSSEWNYLENINISHWSIEGEFFIFCWQIDISSIFQNTRSQHDHAAPFLQLSNSASGWDTQWIFRCHVESSICLRLDFPLSIYLEVNFYFSRSGVTSDASCVWNYSEPFNISHSSIETQFFIFHQQIHISSLEWISNIRTNDH